jgi:hypothetical protein
MRLQRGKGIVDENWGILGRTPNSWVSEFGVRPGIPQFQILFDNDLGLGISNRGTHCAVAENPVTQASRRGVLRNLYMLVAPILDIDFYRFVKGVAHTGVHMNMYRLPGSIEPGDVIAACTDGPWWRDPAHFIGSVVPYDYSCFVGHVPLLPIDCY